MKNHHRRILKVLNDLHNLHPSYNLGKHLSTALDGHDIWAMSDRDFLNALVEYKTKFEMDLKHMIDEEDVVKVIKDGLKYYTTEDLIEEDDEFYE